MYPLAEFRRRAVRAVRRWLFTTLAATATVLLFAVTALHLSDSWSRYDPTRGIVLVWATVAAAAVTLVCELLWRHSRHPFTRCPHCRHRLTDSVPLVVASGCCPLCGERVLEPADDPPAEALIPRADFLAADTGYQSKAVPLIIGGVMASYAGGWGALVVVNHLHLPDAMSGVVFVALVAIAPVSMVVVMRWMAAAGKRNPALACPGCGRLLAGARVLTLCTGNCAWCGCRVIVPRTRPLPPPHLGPMWTIPQLTALEKRRKRAMRWTLGLVGVVAAVTVGLLVLCQLFWNETRLQGMGLPWGTAYFVGKLTALAVGITGAVVVLWVFWLSLRLARRKHPIDCPRCGRDLIVPFARATRGCAQCGRRVVK